MSGTRAKHPLNLLRFGRRLSPKLAPFILSSGHARKSAMAKKGSATGMSASLPNSIFFKRRYSST
jgi:hypothetical protein